MGRLRYTATAPDGTELENITPDHTTHTIMVAGYMRLKKLLPKVDPDNEAEEDKYERFKRWIMIGTTVDQKAAEKLAAIQGYRGITEQVVYLPVTPEVVISDKVFPGRRKDAHQDEDEASTPVVDEPAQELVCSGPLDLDSL